MCTCLARINDMMIGNKSSLEQSDFLPSTFLLNYYLKFFFPCFLFWTVHAFFLLQLLSALASLAIIISFFLFCSFSYLRSLWLNTTFLVKLDGVLYYVLIFFQLSSIQANWMDKKGKVLRGHEGYGRPSWKDMRLGECFHKAYYDRF